MSVWCPFGVFLVTNWCQLGVHLESVPSEFHVCSVFVLCPFHVLYVPVPSLFLSVQYPPKIHQKYESYQYSFQYLKLFFICRQIIIMLWFLCCFPWCWNNAWEAGQTWNDIVNIWPRSGAGQANHTLAVG